MALASSNATNLSFMYNNNNGKDFEVKMEAMQLWKTSITSNMSYFYFLFRNWSKLHTGVVNAALGFAASGHTEAFTKSGSDTTSSIACS